MDPLSLSFWNKENVHLLQLSFKVSLFYIKDFRFCRHIQVHLKEIEYHEKSQYFCHSFQKVKPIYYIDSLHRVKYFKPYFLKC